MRPIKFRGRELLTGRLVYSEFLGLPRFFKLLDDGDIELIGQFTGLHDKNGKEIYEGDIVAFNESVMSDTGEDKPNYIEKRIDNGFIYSDGKRGERRYGRKIKIVEWQKKSCGFEPFSDSHDNCGHCGGGDTPMGCEVIGNIYEHKHLLK